MSYYIKLFLDTIYIFALEISMFFILCLTISSLIGYINVSFAKLINEKEGEIRTRKEIEEKRKSLNTLLKQDIRSKCQTVQGYMQLLKEEMDITEERKKYLDKAIEAGKEVDDILNLARELDEIEKVDWNAEKDAFNMLDNAIEEVSDLAKEKKVRIEKEYKECIGRVKGNYSLDVLLSQILKTRIQVGKCSRFNVNTYDERNKIIINIEDDGEKLSKNVKDILSGMPYTGETSGVGGVRYYMIGEIAKQNEVKIEVEDSTLGGARFDIYLEKIQ